MATLSFTPFIERTVPCPPLEVFGNTVREVLEAYFEKHAHARSCLLDEQGCLRPRLGCSVDGTFVADRVGLSDPVHAHARVCVFHMPLDIENEELH